MDHRSVVNYSYIITTVARLMQSPSVVDSSTGKIPEKASRWDLTRTEACGGRKNILGGSVLVPDFGEFIELKLGQTEE